MTERQQQPTNPSRRYKSPVQTPVQRSRNQTPLPRHDIGEEQQILHSSDVMDVRHFEKVFIRQITARPTHPVINSHQQAVERKSEINIIRSGSFGIMLSKYRRIFSCAYTAEKSLDNPTRPRVPRERRCAMGQRRQRVV